MKFEYFAALGLLIVGMVASSSPAAYEDTVLADSPVVYYRLGEASGATVANNIGSIGDPADGNYFGGVTLGATSLISPSTSGGDTAADFTGASTTSRISVPNHSALNTGGFSARSVELWFNADTLPSEGNFAMLFEEGGEFNGLNIYINGDDLVVGVWGGGDRYWLRAADVLATGEVYHVVASFADSTFTGYLNGQSFGTTSTRASIPAHTGDIVIGAVAAGGSSGSLAQNSDLSVGVLQQGHMFDGIIDEFAMYNSGLSLGQVQSHYTAGGGTLIPEPAAFFGLLAGLALVRRR